jgi:hypothetical protein
MYYIPQATLWPVAPSPLAGLPQAAKTLADAVIQVREKAAFSQDQTLLGETLARLERPGEPQTGYGPEGEPYTIPDQPVDPMAEWENTLTQMKTREGRTAALAEIMKARQVPLYGYEGGQIVQKGVRPGRAEMLPTNPAELEEQRQLGREKIEGQRQLGREKIEGQRQLGQEKIAGQMQEHQIKLETMRQEAKGAGDWRKYDMIMDVEEKRAELKEKLQGAKTDKERWELKTKHFLDLQQRSKENLSRREGNIRKQFTSYGGDITDIAGYETALREAQLEHQQETEVIRSAYADVIQKYGIKGGNQGPAGTAQVGGGGKDYYQTFKQSLNGPNRQAAIDYAAQNYPDYLEQAKKEGLLK